MDRLSRNPVDGGIIAYLLQTGQLEFIRTTERIYRPDSNALVLSIENGMATAYLQDLSRNVKRGLRGKVERGWHPCKAPVGYLNDPETREIVIDPERFPLVQKAFKLAMQGDLPINEIHRKLVQLGLTAYVRGRTTRRPISDNCVHSMLRSRFYTGMVRFNGKFYPGKHRPAVTGEEFELVQRRLAERGWRRTEGRKSLPLANLFRCSACGCMIVGEVKRRNLAGGGTRIHTYLHCSGWKGCRRICVREEDLAAKLAKALHSLSLPIDVASNIKRSLSQVFEQEGCNEAETLAALQKEAERNESRLRRLTELRLDGEISAEEFSGLRENLLERSDSLREETHFARDTARRELELIYRKLDEAVAAGELKGGSGDLYALAKAAQVLGGTTLDIKTLTLSLDPVLKTIASFERPDSKSGSSKLGDSDDQNPVWSSYARQLRTAVKKELATVRCTDSKSRCNWQEESKRP